MIDLEIIIKKLINPHTLARLVVVWVVFTALFSVFNTAQVTIVTKQNAANVAIAKAINEQDSIVLNEKSNAENKTKKDTSHISKEEKRQLSELEAIFALLGEKTQSGNTQDTEQKNILQYPTKIEIPSKKISVQVLNPQTTNIKKLDEALMKGAVRYPTSGLLGEKDKAIVVFGHTSYVPGFFGAYRYFNGVDKLKEGEEVILYSHNKKYVYRVSNKTKIKADSEISLKTNNNKLVLITCDGFGTKSLRYKVEADLIRIENIK